MNAHNSAEYIKLINLVSLETTFEVTAGEISASEFQLVMHKSLLALYCSQCNKNMYLENIFSL